MKTRFRKYSKILFGVIMMLYFVAVSNNVYADDVQFTQKTYKILFVGNSHTYYNDMPKMFKGLCDADKINCEVTSITSPGYKLSQFADKTNMYGSQVYQALTNNTWDYVVLQENRAVLVEKEEEAEAAVNTLYTLIHNAGAKMVIYATQPNNIGSTFKVDSLSLFLSDFQIEQILTRNNFKIADEYDGLVAASGTNFMRVMQDYPKITMYKTDNLHPSVTGSYLAACTIYNTIFDRSPYGNKYLPNSEYDKDNLISKVSMKNALIMQKIADSRLKVDSYYTTVSKGQNSKLTATFTSTQTDESETTEDTTKKTKDETKTSDEKETTVTDNKDTISTYTNCLKMVFSPDNIVHICAAIQKHIDNIIKNKCLRKGISYKAGKYQVMSTTDSGLICYSTIDVKQPSTAFNINESKILKVVKGYVGKYTTTIAPDDTTDTITWKSNYPDIVSVDAQGNIQAKKVGIAKITAVTTSGIKSERYVRVKLKTPSNVKLTKKVRKVKKKKVYRVNVKWSKNKNATKYYVFRKKEGKKVFKRVATTTQAKYIDKNIKKNKTYSYKIQAIYSNSKLNSDKTAEYNIKVK